MRIAFVTPPLVKPSEPGLSAAAAASVLMRNGIDADWIDGSLDFHRFALSQERLRATLGRLEGVSPRARRAMEQAAASMGRSPPVLKRRATYESRSAYTSAVNELENALSLVAAPHRGFRLGVAMVALEDPPRRLESSTTLAWLAANEGPFDAYFVEELIPRIASGRYSHVALSLTFQQQAPAAFRLAHLLEERAPSIQRLLGGPLVACWANMGVSFAGEAFRSFHRVLPGTPSDLATVAFPGATDLAPPRFDLRGPLTVPLDQAHWDDYLAPIPTVPAALALGCYYRRCTFCPDHLHGVHQTCTREALNTFLHQVSARFPEGAMLHLTDSALPPAHLETIASIIAEDQLPLRFHGFIRAEEEFSRPEFAHHLARGGCVMLQLGVESGSERLHRMMGKGAGPERCGAVLEATARAGILNHVYLLFGLPTETDEDREATLSFVKDRGRFIDAINPALLNLPKGSPMHRHAERFGVTAIVPFGQDTDLSLYDDFRCGDSHPRREARRWLAHRFFKDPDVRRIQGGLSAPFKANHLCFMESKSAQRGSGEACGTTRA